MCALEGRNPQFVKFTWGPLGLGPPGLLKAPFGAKRLFRSPNSRVFDLAGLGPPRD